MIRFQFPSFDSLSLSLSARSREVLKRGGDQEKWLENCTPSCFPNPTFYPTKFPTFTRSSRLTAGSICLLRFSFSFRASWRSISRLISRRARSYGSRSFWDYQKSLSKTNVLRGDDFRISRISLPFRDDLSRKCRTKLLRFT